jgi:Heavy metal associated domain 2
MNIPGLQIPHVSPGRIRVRLDKIKGNSNLARELEQRLARLEYLQKIEVNPVTGSVLITYDPHQLATLEHDLGDIVHELLALAKTLQLIPPQYDTTELEQLARQASNSSDTGLASDLANALQRWLAG